MKIGIISDIHEDITRLKQAIEVLEKEKCKQIVCLGDSVGYSVPYYGFLWSRNSHEVIKLLKKKCNIILAGNHDLYSVRKLPKYTAGFNYPKNWYSLDYQERVKLSKDKVYLYEYNELPALLTKEDKEFIKKLPEFVVKKYDGVNILFSHYAYPDLVGTTTFEPKTQKDVKRHFAFMKEKGCKIGISGHDHKEGIMLFTQKEAKHIPFGKVTLNDNPVWFHGPGVVNGSFENGVMTFDTEKLEITTIPLSSPKHTPPEWRKL